MRHILYPGSLGMSNSAARDCASYQTNPNPSEHSKSDLLRLTLVTLWNLRVPPMVRTALIALLAVPFLTSSTGASPVDGTRMTAHASISKSTVHRARGSARPVSRRSRTNTSGGTRTTASRTVPRRSARYSTAGRHSSSFTRRRTSLHRVHYSVRRSRAHFVPLAAAPVSPSESRASSESGSEGTVESDHLSALPTVEPAHALSPEAHAAADHPTPGEGDIALPPGTDPSATATGNPLASPPATATAAASGGQIAELHLPRFPQSTHLGSYALRGTHDSLVRQNERSEEEALERIEDDADLQDRIARGMLVRVPESSALSVNPELPDDRRYCRPWTANFLTDLSRAHNAVFHKALVVSSAVRTVEYQKHLMHVNHNAADAEGDIVSPHLTGATIDVAKSGLSRREMQWMRSELLAYQNAGLIDVEEEFRQRCFHITVYKAYDSVTQSKPAGEAAPAANSSALPAGPGDASVKDQ